MKHVNKSDWGQTLCPKKFSHNYHNLAKHTDKLFVIVINVDYCFFDKLLMLITQILFKFKIKFGYFSPNWEFNFELKLKLRKFTFILEISVLQILTKYWLKSKF
jgi:hypothetical protein